MVSVEEAMQHLRVDSEDERNSLEAMISAATAAAWDYLNIEPIEPIPAPVKAAILLQVGDLYANRERQGAESYYENSTYERLLNPYRAMAI